MASVAVHEWAVQSFVNFDRMCKHTYLTRNKV